MPSVKSDLKLPRRGHNSNDNKKEGKTEVQNKENKEKKTEHVIPK